MRVLFSASVTVTSISACNRAEDLEDNVTIRRWADDLFEQSCCNGLVQRYITNPQQLLGLDREQQEAFRCDRFGLVFTP